MNIGLGLARLLILVGGVGLTLLGLALVAIVGPDGSLVGIYAVGLGLALIVAALIERVRYRSDAAEREAAPIGPGGGEPTDAMLEPRFRATDEVFIDPTTGHRMRVWLDSRSGERRYRAEA